MREWGVSSKSPEEALSALQTRIDVAVVQANFNMMDVRAASSPATRGSGHPAGRPAFHWAHAAVLRLPRRYDRTRRRLSTRRPSPRLPVARQLANWVDGAAELLRATASAHPGIDGALYRTSFPASVVSWLYLPRSRAFPAPPGSRGPNAAASDRGGLPAAVVEAANGDQSPAGSSSWLRASLFVTETLDRGILMPRLRSWTVSQSARQRTRSSSGSPANPPVLRLASASVWRPAPNCWPAAREIALD